MRAPEEYDVGVVFDGLGDVDTPLGACPKIDEA
jgi:hypothetical protein